MLKYIILSLLLVTALTNYAQQASVENYTGAWKGVLSVPDNLVLDITIAFNGDNALFKLSKGSEILKKEFQTDNKIDFVLEDGFAFRGIINQDKKSITGFMKSNMDLYPVKLSKKEEVYVGKWNLSANHHLAQDDIKLDIVKVNDGGYVVYPKLGSYWVSDFEYDESSISFKDYKTNLKFEGQLNPSEMVIEISLGDNFITKATFVRDSSNQASSFFPIDYKSVMNDGLEVADNQLELPKMEENILSNVLEGMEGILIAKSGKIIYEKYFAGFDVTTPHDTRSASKSVASAIIGIAIDDEILKDVNEKLYDGIPEEYQYTRDSLKAQITLKDLLTMSSGLDVNNKAYEGYYQNETKDPWLTTVLKAPMVHKPGTYSDYGSANPFLLGVVRISLKLYRFTWNVTLSLSKGKWRTAHDLLFFFSVFA